MNHNLTQAYAVHWLASVGASPLSSPNATMPKPG
jgi:hypothetical protein